MKLPESKLETAWSQFYKMRVSIKKPATDYAKKLLHNKALKLSEGDEKLMIEIINQSIINCYQDLYPLKPEKSVNSAPQNPYRNG